MNYIEAVLNSTNIEEGYTAVESFLITVFLEQPIANKKVSQKLLLPIPLVTAMKREFMRHGLMMQQGGMCLTEKGIRYVEDMMGFKDLIKSSYRMAMRDWDIRHIFKETYSVLEDVFEGRPEADRRVDQAHCTLDTSLKRSLLTIKHHCLINKKLLCVGDDDLVSVSLGVLLKNLEVNCRTEIHVIDQDQRLIDYIESVAEDLALPIICHKMDLREPMLEALKGTFDCFFTDPPYTLSGMKLFMSRGIEALCRQTGSSVFLSFGHKSYDMSHRMMDLLCKMGLAIKEVLPRFNTYEGAAILGNTSQMLVMKTSSNMRPAINENKKFNEAIYTRAFQNKLSINQKGDNNDTRKSI